MFQRPPEAATPSRSAAVRESRGCLKGDNPADHPDCFERRLTYTVDGAPDFRLKIVLGIRFPCLIIVYRGNCFLQECPRLKYGESDALLAEATHHSVEIVPKLYHAIAQVHNSTMQIRLATWGRHNSPHGLPLPVLPGRMLATRKD